MQFDRDYILSNSEQDDTGCWNWTKFVKPNGYGQIGRNGYAHRAAYQAFVEEIPGGLDVDHKCMNKACVNPDHLHVVTRQKNMQLHWQRVGLHKRCRRGHELTPENRKPRSMGRPGWVCRACQNLKRMERYYRLREMGYSGTEAANR